MNRIHPEYVLGPLTASTHHTQKKQQLLVMASFAEYTSSAFKVSSYVLQTATRLFGVSPEAEGSRTGFILKCVPVARAFRQRLSPNSTRQDVEKLQSDAMRQIDAIATEFERSTFIKK